MYTVHVELFKLMVTLSVEHRLDHPFLLQQLGPIPKSSSAPDPSTYLLHHHQSVDNTRPNLPIPTTAQWTDGPAVKAHKRQVAEAAENVQGGMAGRKPLKEPQSGKIRLSLPTTATSVAFQVRCAAGDYILCQPSFPHSLLYSPHLPPISSPPTPRSFSSVPPSLPPSHSFPLPLPSFPPLPTQATHVHSSKSDSSALALPPPSSSPSSPSPSSAVHNTLPSPEMNTSHSQEDTNMFSSHPHTSSSKAERYVPAAVSLQSSLSMGSAECKVQLNFRTVPILAPNIM